MSASIARTLSFNPASIASAVAFETPARTRGNRSSSKQLQDIQQDVVENSF